ncbi:MAG: isocitrate lyase/phosphoenolpyruvate mutase family protein [Pseudomonadota bacterium]
MSRQADLFEKFAALHTPGDPLVLYNAWDAGSAAVIEAAGAPAVATGSWSVAGAQGYDDGQALPLDHVLMVAANIVRRVSVPVSLDFESGYATAPDDLVRTTMSVLETGIVGVNFEDQDIAAGRLFATDRQVERIGALREAAQAAGQPLWINARTDVFLNAPPEEHATHVDEAIGRVRAYAAAGGNSVFVPGLTDPNLVQKVCAASEAPVNVMASGGGPTRDDIAALGVARISYGPGPFRDAMARLESAAQAIYAD